MSNKNAPKPHSPASNANPRANKGQHIGDTPPKNDNNPIQQESGRRGTNAEVISPEGKSDKSANMTSPLDSLLDEIGWDTKPLMWLAAGTVAFILFWKLA